MKITRPATTRREHDRLEWLTYPTLPDGKPIRSIRRVSRPDEIVMLTEADSQLLLGVLSELATDWAVDFSVMEQAILRVFRQRSLAHDRIHSDRPATASD